MTAPAADLFDRIVTALRAMDAEAQPVNRTPTGLSWYGGWARRDLKRPHTEVEWTRALATRLGGQREVAYPADTRKRCDLVVDGCWIEVKGLWPAWWAARGQRSIYEAYLFDPLKPYPALKKPHTAARDLIKLRGLAAGDAAMIGLVLIGFDAAAAPCDADIAEFARLGGLEEWWHGSAAWTDAQRPGESVKVWGWFKERV